MYVGDVVYVGDAFHLGDAVHVGDDTVNDSSDDERMKKKEILTFI